MSRLDAGGMIAFCVTCGIYLLRRRRGGGAEHASMASRSGPYSSTNELVDEKQRTLYVLCVLCNVMGYEYDMSF